MRVENQISSQFNTTQLNTPKQAQQVQTAAEQVQQRIFGRPRPSLLDPASIAGMAELLRALGRFRKRLAHIAGDQDADYQIVLADDTIACIDEHGTIFMGAGFLQAHAQNMPLLVGVLAHEVGHRPKRWQRGFMKDTRRALTEPQLQELCRHEETLADLFAGKALAELGLSWEPLVKFLELVQVRPHPEYLPAQVRGDIIRDAHGRSAYRINAQRKLYPEKYRFTHAKGYLGEI